ncbi:MAG: hypothetical protein NC338_06185 [Firmicutes bacterium]|nr:hypothetical protein [Bacillota bacterium]MCM1401824.1 hypothetical protein [Bacteroides sp.]MCM1477940.1 hypothetical protein [Bacteroides sp.]
MKFATFVLCASIYVAAAFSAVAATGKADSLALAANKAPTNTSLNLQAGRALYEAGLNKRAMGYLSRGGNDAQPWLALVEFEDYQFDKAQERAEKYLASKHNTESAEHALAQEVIDKVNLARTMLDRVEKVQIIDSIVVPRDEFFKAYRISPSTGSVASTSVLPKDLKSAANTTVYVSENGERMMWGQTEANGNVNVVESNHLADGTWETPHSLGSNLPLGGNANYPFLLSDGITLYYASDGEGSLGGYDIYITRNDGDRYLNPQNLGMPYNSPMDDYLLAIDDATGAGWWATDRNLIPDSVTIYVFVPQDLRDNYPVDGTPDLVDRARITSIKATQQPGKDYASVLNAIKNVNRPQGNETSSSVAFALAMPDGRVLHSLSDFTEPEASEMMEGYLQEIDDFTNRTEALKVLRRKYAAGDSSVADEIRNEEVELEQLRIQLRHLQNDVIKAEMRNTGL